MDLVLLLLSLLESGQGGLQVLGLVVLLFLDVSVDIDRFGILRLDPWVEVLVDHLLEFLKVIDVLGAPVDSILEGANTNLIVSELGSILSDGLHHVGLSLLKTVDHETKIGIESVELHQLKIHVFSLLLE